ncbi:MAG: nucleoside triphosphate pyrophosphohydrolase [Patescibacteria group bacterium]
MIKHHNKLVRGKIPDIIQANGATPVIRVITDDSEYLSALGDKLLEEAGEVRREPSLDELADAQEVVNALTRALGHTLEDLESARQQKADKRGDFEGRIYLVSTEE